MRIFLAAQGMFPRKISFGADSLTGTNNSVLVGSVLVGSVLFSSVLVPLCPRPTGEDTAVVPPGDPCIVEETVFLGVDTILVQMDTFDLIGLDILVLN